MLLYIWSFLHAWGLYYQISCLYLEFILEIFQLQRDFFIPFFKKRVDISIIKIVSMGETALRPYKWWTIVKVINQKLKSTFIQLKQLNKNILSHKDLNLGHISNLKTIWSKKKFFSTWFILIWCSREIFLLVMKWN